MPDETGAPLGATRAPRWRRRRIALLLAALVVLLAAGAAIWWFARPAAPPTYLMATLTRGTVSRTVTATGTVNPVMTIIVGSYVSGVIKEVYCDFNTRVKKGQLCAKIDSRPYETALEQAEGALARDSAQLAGARADLARYAALITQHLVAQITYANQEALVHQLEGSVQLDRALVSTAKVNLGYTNIVSPVDGTVVARSITVGQTVAASFQTPTLFLIATDLTRMQVDTNVSESDIGTIKDGDPGQFTVEAFPGQIFRGSVVQVRQAPQVVQNVVTYDAVVSVANPNFVLKPGMTATVNIITAQRNDVVRIPDQALRYSPGGLSGPASAGGTTEGQLLAAAAAPGGRPARVWVLRQSRPAAVAVHVGLDDGRYSELMSGDLRPGEQVIVGQQLANAAAAQARPLRLGHL
ncbi:MAG: efflux RND transporter periplasmic adaptor subunit [Steroidobacteraceae bacterium]